MELLRHKDSRPRVQNSHSAAKQVRLYRDAVAMAPFIDATTDSGNGTRNFTTWSSRHLNGNRKCALFGPEIQTIESTRTDANHYLVGAGLRVRHVAQFKFTWHTVLDELERFHTLNKALLEHFGFSMRAQPVIFLQWQRFESAQ
jgi:hypothetical protein